jgi:hypothetical protein
MKTTITDNDIIHDAISLVNEGRPVTFPVKGYSMLPFIIGGRDSVDLVKPGTPKVGDVVLAWVEQSRYVIHRIIRIDGDRVTLMGDGNVRGVEHCLVSDVAALALNVVTPGKKHRHLYSKWMLRGCRLWWRLLPVRRWLLAIYRRTWLKLVS